MCSRTLFHQIMCYPWRTRIHDSSSEWPSGGMDPASSTERLPVYEWENLLHHHRHRRHIVISSVETIPSTQSRVASHTLRPNPDPFFVLLSGAGLCIRHIMRDAMRSPPYLTVCLPWALRYRNGSFSVFADAGSNPLLCSTYARASTRKSSARMVW